MPARTSKPKTSVASKTRSAPAASTTDIATALHRGDHALALGAALAAWRANPSDALADAIDAIGRKLPDDPIEQQLAQMITPRVASTITRWKALAKVRDPRVSRFAIARLVDLPFTGNPAEPLLEAFIATIVRLADRRVAAYVDEIRDGIEARFVRRDLKTNLFARLAVAAKLGARPAGPALPAALATAVAALGEGSRTDNELLAAIYANPTDDGPRAVYADFLQETGDPRGEFIAIQLAHTDRPRDADLTPRELELLKKHGKLWLGGLAPALSWGKGYANTHFRRGFVATADIILSVGKKLALVAKDPGWATVEEIVGFYEPVLLRDAPLRALVALENPPDDEAFAMLAEAKVTLPLTTIEDQEHDPIDLAIARRVCPAATTVRIWRYVIGPAILPELAKLDIEHVFLQRYWPQGAAAVRAQVAEHTALIAAITASKPLGKIARITLAVPSNNATIPTPLHFVRGPKGTYTRAVDS